MYFVLFSSWLLKVANLTTHVYGGPTQGVISMEFHQDQKTIETLSYCATLFHGPLFSRFDRTQTCDRRTDRQTDRLRAVACSGSLPKFNQLLYGIGVYIIYGNAVIKRIKPIFVSSICNIFIQYSTHYR